MEEINKRKSEKKSKRRKKERLVNTNHDLNNVNIMG